MMEKTELRRRYTNDDDDIAAADYPDDDAAGLGFAMSKPRKNELVELSSEIERHTQDKK